MKKIRLLFSAAMIAAAMPVFAQSGKTPSAQEFTGNEAANICTGSTRVLINKQSRVPSFIVFSKGTSITAFALSGGSPSGGTYSGPGVSGGMFDPATAGVGTHTITYTYTDSSNCTGSVSSNIFVDVCTGISAAASGNNLNVYPNPASAQLTIELKLDKAEAVTVSLVNLLGQEIYISQTEQQAGPASMQLNTASLPRGVYLLMVKTASGTQMRKIELQ